MIEEGYHNGADKISLEETMQLLSDALGDRGKSPPRLAPELAELTLQINTIKFYHHVYTVIWRPHFESGRRLADAITTILELAPSAQAQCSSGLEATEVMDMDEGSERLRKTVASLEGLIAAAGDAQNVGLTESAFLSQPTDFPIIEQYPLIVDAFHVATDARNPPASPKAAGYRFAASVASLITGKAITPGSVESDMKKNRHVNRGKNILVLTRGG